VSVVRWSESAGGAVGRGAPGPDGARAPPHGAHRSVATRPSAASLWTIYAAAAVTQTIHIHPTAPLAARVLLPGDPGRALRLAQSLLREPRMFNHNRGLWGYTGAAHLDEQPLTIQSTGMGGPSAAIVIAELADLGARTLVRVGTCGAITPASQLGEIVAVGEALAADGTSRALGAESRVTGSDELLARLRAAAGSPRVVMTATTDLFYDGPEGAEEAWAREGAAVVEMETAPLFALGARRGLSTGCLLIVSDLLLATRRRIDAAALHAAEQRIGEIAVRALAPS
jgi:purine-nucleoside phosphorylase